MHIITDNTIFNNNLYHQSIDFMINMCLALSGGLEYTG